MQSTTKFLIGRVRAANQTSKDTKVSNPFNKVTKHTGELLFLSNTIKLRFKLGFTRVGVRVSGFVSSRSKGMVRKVVGPAVVVGEMAEAPPKPDSGRTPGGR